MSTQRDRWLLPRHQTEYPTWDLVAEDKLHGRREATFLVLAACVAIAAAGLFAFGRLVDVSASAAQVVPDLELPPLTAPIGVLPAVVGLAALLLACELYGRRRAVALLVAGALVGGAIAGLALFAASLTAPAAIALAAYYVVAHGASLVMFGRSTGKRLWLRMPAAITFGVLAGWLASGAALYLLAREPDLDAIVAITGGSAAITIAGALVLALPLALIARGLALFLRVARSELQVLAQTEDDVARAPTLPTPPYSHAELRFFQDGENASLT